MTFAVILLVGPGEERARRTAEMLESFWYYQRHGDPVDLYMVNDQCRHLDLLEAGLRPFRQVVKLDNPLAGKSEIMMDRLTAGLLYGLIAMESICHEYDYLLKLDDDALVIGDFHPRLQRFFASHGDAGMVGTLTRFPDGSVRPGNDSWAPLVKKTISGKRIFPELKAHLRGHRKNALIGGPLKRFRMGHRARANGYTPGWHVQGGSYAVSPEAVRRSAQAVGDWRLFNHTGVGEDVILSMVVKSVGLDLKDYNQSGEVFGVWWRTPSLSPEELVRRDYAIIHSIKYEDSSEEDRVRGFFRQRRN